MGMMRHRGMSTDLWGTAVVRGKGRYDRVRASHTSGLKTIREDGDDDGSDMQLRQL